MSKFKVVFLICVVLANSSFALAKKQIIKIGAGSLLGSDYSVALELCKFIQLSDPDHNTKCRIVPVESSIKNLSLLQEGKIDLGLVHANIAIQAFEGKGYYANSKPMTNISQVLKLHDKTFTVIVRDNEKIKVLADINNKKISIGSNSSDGRIVYNDLSKLYNFEKEPIDIILNHENCAQEFCAGKVDSMVLMTGHPNALIRHIAHHCEINFLHIEDNKIEQFIKTNPEFHKTILNKSLYAGITEDQSSFSVPVLLVTTDKINPIFLKNFMHYFVKHLERFRTSHIILNKLNDSNYIDNLIPINETVKEIVTK